MGQPVELTETLVPLHSICVNFYLEVRSTRNLLSMSRQMISLVVSALAIGQAVDVVSGIPDFALRTATASILPDELKASTSWNSATFGDAASGVAALDDTQNLDIIVLYLHRAASLPGGTLNNWLSFARSLIVFASAGFSYSLSNEQRLVEHLATDAFHHTARALLPNACLPTNEAELIECRSISTLARDVLAELIVHCDNADGALWDRCPQTFLQPLRATELPTWPPEDVERTASTNKEHVPCNIDRRDWPDLSAEDFERDYNGPGVPVIVRNLTQNWPANAWTDSVASEWLYLRLAQSTVRSLMRRAHGLPPQLDTGTGAGTGASGKPADGSALFRVSQFRGGMVLPNQYIQLDDTNLPYRQALKVAYERPSIVQQSLFDTEQCFPRHRDFTDAKAQRAAFHIHSRWLLVSAAGSGSGWHIDPWNTSAWNALLLGRKRWALYPPNVSGLPAGVANATPADFFDQVLPSLPAEDRPLQCVLEPGETMFLPSGWWHAVLNLERSIAITENRVDDQNVQAVLEEMRAVDPQSESGMRAAKMCEAARAHPFDRGTYPRDCDERLDRSRSGSPEILDCIRRMESACDAKDRL